jgi:hypothetical protein
MMASKEDLQFNPFHDGIYQKHHLLIVCIHANLEFFNGKIIHYIASLVREMTKRHILSTILLYVLYLSAWDPILIRTQ